MARRLILLSIISICGLLVGPFAAAQRTCEELFLFQAKTRTEIQGDLTFELPRPTVKILDIVTNRNGESFFVLERMPGEESWFSAYAAKGYDLQGNPKWPIEHLGSKLSEVLGFSTDALGRYLVPTPETYNSRIATFNKFLVANQIKPIPVLFYTQKNAVMRAFLARWFGGFELPVAANRDTHTVHDIAFHYSAILLPDAFAKLIQIESGLAHHWSDMLQSQRADPSKSVIIRQSVSLVDVLSTSANADGGTIQRSLEDYLGRYLALPPTPSTAPEIQAQNLTSAVWGRYAARFSSLDTFLLRVRAVESWSAEALLTPEADSTAKENFIKRMRIDLPDSGKTLAELGLVDFDSIVALFARRSNELRAAAVAFKAEHP